MKHLQINTAPIGAQEYNLGEKVGEDIYIYKSIPFYRYVSLQLDGVPKYFRTRVYVNLRYQNESGWPRFIRTKADGADYYSFNKRDNFRYELSQDYQVNPLTLKSTNGMDLALRSSNANKSWLVVASYDFKDYKWHYNPQWKSYITTPTPNNYELYLTDSEDDLESTDNPITTDSRIHSITERLEEDGNYRIIINFMS